MKAIIVENETGSASVLRTMLQNYCPGVNVMEDITSASDAIEKLPVLDPDLIFFDIDLGDGDAFDVLKQINGNAPPIIFTTAFNAYAIQAFKFSAVDYLLKPINIRELQSAVERARNLFDYKTQARKMEALMKNLVDCDFQFGKVTLPTMEGFVFADIKNIIRLEADGSYTRFYFSDKTQLMVSHNLKEYEELFSAHHFFRVHHSHIINLNHIKKYVKSNGGYVVMDDGSQVDVASRRKESLMKVLGFN